MELLELLKNYISREIIDDYLKMLAQRSRHEENISTEDIRYAHSFIRKLVPAIKDVSESSHFITSNRFLTLINDIYAWSDLDKHKKLLAVVSSKNTKEKILHLVTIFNGVPYACEYLAYINSDEFENIKLGDGYRLRSYPTDDNRKLKILEATPTSEPLDDRLLQIIPGKLGKKLNKQNRQRFIVQDGRDDLWLSKTFISSFKMKPQKSYNIKMVVRFNRNNKIEYTPVAVV